MSQFLPFQGDAFSIHDNELAAVHHMEIEEGETNLVMDAPGVRELRSFYDELFVNDRLSSSIMKKLERCRSAKKIQGEAHWQYGLVKQLLKSPDSCPPIQARKIS